MNTFFKKLLISFFIINFSISNAYSKEAEIINNIKQFSGFVISPNQNTNDKKSEQNSFLITLFYLSQDSSKPLIFATTITDDNNYFILDLKDKFYPKKGDVFILDANNKDLFRLRSRIIWNGLHWENYAKNEIRIDVKSTALSIISNLSKDGINYPIFNTKSSMKADFNNNKNIEDCILNLEKLIIEALENNRDPISSILYLDSTFYIDNTDILQLLKNHKKCLYCDFSTQDLNKLNLENIDISNSNISNQKFKNKNFNNSILKNVEVNSTLFEGCTLNGVNLKNSRIDNSNFIDSSLSNSDLSESKIQNSDFKNIDFKSSDFQKTVFWRTKFDYAVFSNTNISNTLFYEVQIKNADFKNSIISNVEFKESNLEKVNIGISKINNKIKIIECNLINSNLSNMNIEGLYFNKNRIYLTDFENTKSIFAEFNNTSIENSNFRNTLFESTYFKNCEINNSKFLTSNFNLLNIENCKSNDSDFINLKNK